MVGRYLRRWPPRPAALRLHHLCYLTITAAQQSGGDHHDSWGCATATISIEMQIAGMNETMAPEVHTVFVRASVARPPDHRHTGTSNRANGRGTSRRSCRHPVAASLRQIRRARTGLRAYAQP